MVLSYASEQPLVAKTKPTATRVESSRAARSAYVDSDAADTWARTIEQLPTTAGKLFYVACLRQEGSETYRHQGLSRIYSEEQADRVLRASHEAVFADWLNFSLEQQYNDLRVHLLAAQLAPADLEPWLDPQTYDRFVPSTANQPERALYRTDLETILEILKREL
jgi:hypothetical protein